MRAFASLFILLAVAPAVLAMVLFFLLPVPFSGAPTPWNALKSLGFATGPLWLTCVPVIILIPVLMNRLARRPQFISLSLPLFIGIALFAGAAAGVYALGPMLMAADRDIPGLLASMVLAGAIAGAISFILIGLIYRFRP